MTTTGGSSEAVREISSDDDGHRVEIDPDAFDQPSVAIPYALAKVRDVDPLDLPPLEEYVQTQALNQLLESGDTTLTIYYDGTKITIREDELHIAD